MQGAWLWSLGGEDPLEKEMAFGYWLQDFRSLEISWPHRTQSALPKASISTLRLSHTRKLASYSAKHPSPILQPNRGTTLHVSRQAAQSHTESTDTPSHTTGPSHCPSETQDLAPPTRTQTRIPPTRKPSQGIGPNPLRGGRLQSAWRTPVCSSSAWRTPVLQPSKKRSQTE